MVGGDLKWLTAFCVYGNLAQVLFICTFQLQGPTINSYLREEESKNMGIMNLIMFHLRVQIFIQTVFLLFFFRLLVFFLVCNSIYFFIFQLPK